MIIFLDGGSTDMIPMFYMKIFKRYVHSNYVYLSYFLLITRLLEHCNDSGCGSERDSGNQMDFDNNNDNHNDQRQRQCKWQWQLCITRRLSW